MILIPGDPRTTQYVKTFQTISGLIERSSTMYLTAGDYAAVMAEFNAQYSDCLMDPDSPKPWKQRRDAFVIGAPPNNVLTVVNAGTDDQAEVNRRNHETPGAVHFQERKEKLRVG